jgi:small subunit ribosomal protein S14
MSFKKLIIKDLKKRQLVNLLEKKKILYKFFLQNLKFSKLIKYYFYYKLNKLKRNSNYIRIKNRCILTGNQRSCYRFFKMSRIQIKDLCNKNNFIGIRKSSW